MRTLCCLALVVLASSVNATTLRFEVTDSPADALRYSGGLSGYMATARIAGGFSITFQSDNDASLHDVELRLVDVLDNLDLRDDLKDGDSLRRVLPVDLELLPGLGNGSQFFFGETFAGIPTEPYASMQVDLTGNQAVVKLRSRLNAINTIDGASVSFRPIAATMIAEPTTLAVSVSSVLALSLLRRRPDRRR